MTQDGIKADYNNPFNVRIFTILLSMYFSDGSQSVEARYPEVFKSSTPDKQHEKEIPEAMLGLVCAVVQDCIALNIYLSSHFTARRLP